MSLRAPTRLHWRHKILLEPLEASCPFLASRPGSSEESLSGVLTDVQGGPGLVRFSCGPCTGLSGCGFRLGRFLGEVPVGFLGHSRCVEAGATRNFSPKCTPKFVLTWTGGMAKTMRKSSQPEPHQESHQDVNAHRVRTAKSTAGHLREPLPTMPTISKETRAGSSYCRIQKDYRPPLYYF